MNHSTVGRKTAAGWEPEAWEPVANEGDDRKEMKVKNRELNDTIPLVSFWQSTPRALAPICALRKKSELNILLTWLASLLSLYENEV